MTRFVLPFLITTISISVHAQDTLRYTMYYDTDRFQPNANELLELKKTVQFTDNIEYKSIMVYGFCDDVGSENYNQALSERRARALAAALHQIPGLDKIRIQVVGKGEIPLQETADTFATRSLNRRTDIVLVYTFSETSIDGSPDFEEMEVGQKMVLDNILFVGGLREFLPESYPALEDLVKKLKASPNVKVRIIGHVCCTGGQEGEDLETGEFNLSVIRAQTVYLYLVNHGIAKERLSFIGKGGSEPLGGDIKYDRRVELEIVGK